MEETAVVNNTTQGIREILCLLSSALVSSAAASHWPDPAKSLENTAYKHVSLPIQSTAEEGKKWI